MPKSEAADAVTMLSLGRYTPDAKAWIVSAQTLADERGHAEIGPLHLLARGLGHPGISEAFRRAGAEVGELSASVERALGSIPKSKEPAYLSGRLLDLFARAERDADRERAKEVSVEHLLSALAQEIRGPAGEILGAFRIGPGSLKAHLSSVRSGLRGAPSFGVTPESLPEEPRDLVLAAKSAPGDPVVGRQDELRRLVTILERRQKSHPLLTGEPGVGKRAVVRGLARILANGDVPPGLAQLRLLEVDVGSLVSGTRARADAEARVRRLVEASQGGAETVFVVYGIEGLFAPSSVVSGAGDAFKAAVTRGLVRLLGTTTPEGARRIEEREPGLLRQFTALEIAEPPRDLAIEMLRAVAQSFEKHHSVRIGEGAVSAAVTLAKRYLSDRFLPDSAVDLLDEAAARLSVESDGVPLEIDTLSHRLDSVLAQLASLEGVDDAPTRNAVSKLRAEEIGLSPRVVEMRKKTAARRGAVSAVRALRTELDTLRAAESAARSNGDAARANELERTTIVAVAQNLASAEETARALGVSPEPAILREEHVAETLALWTGIPVAKMLEAEADKLLHMEERLERRVLGQSEAVRALSRAVRRGRVGLRDSRRPIGSFLFLGPSGVGKTELAKALAEFLFDDEAALTRLDMSEFMERHMAARLVGSPPGYADSEQGGFLTEAVRRRPFSVLLFDEVEKAHQDVFNLLLQVLDDGRLTDGRGRLADFTNTVVILTSNIGSERILSSGARVLETEDGREALRDVLLLELAKFFRPEFLNRLDDVLVFHPLGREDLARIVDIQLAKVRELLAPKEIDLEIDGAAKARLVELGYDPALGARPLRRAIVKFVQDPLAEKLLRRDSDSDGGGGTGGGIEKGARLRLVLDGDGDGFVFDVVSSRGSA